MRAAPGRALARRLRDRAIGILLGFLLPAIFPFAAHSQQELIDLYYSAVEPELKAAVVSEDQLLDAIDTYFAWSADVQAAGHYGELFEVDDGLILIGQAVDFAILQASADCVTNRDPGEAANILYLYGLSQLYLIDLAETGGEMIARFNTCAQFRMTFHSVLTTRIKKDKIVSTVSGAVTLEPTNPKTGIGLWEGFAEVLTHVSLTSTTKSRAKRCKQTWGGEDSRLSVPGAVIRIMQTKYLDESAGGKPGKPSASVTLAIDEVYEFFKIVCKNFSNDMMFVNFNSFFTLHRDRWNGLGLKFDYDAGWEALGEPYLSLGSERELKIKGNRVSEETLIEIFHTPEAYDE